MSDRRSFVDALLVAPVGVTLLALLEGAVRADAPHWVVPTDCDPDSVGVAADAVVARSFGSLVASAVDAASVRVGPWIPSAATELAAAYRHAEDRIRIAHAIDDRFGDQLHAPIDRDSQQWWHGERPTANGLVESRFRSFDRVYGAGQFTEAGVWTVSEPPPEAHADLVSAWELDPDPVSRWRLPVRPGARIAEIHRPHDWVRLVTAHPAAGPPSQECWELPGPNQDPRSLTALISMPQQRAARTSIRRHLVPNWASVAADHDGVHLSWAGFLTTEGYVSDLGGGGDVAMLRYWFSERTHWLTDAFGEPEPLDAPDLDPDGTALLGVDARHDDARRQRDQLILNAQLGRWSHQNGASTGSTSSPSPTA